MNDRQIVELQGHLSKQVDMVSRSATVEDLTRTAARIAGGLTREERDAAAMLYVLRLLKERHRGAVADMERAAQRRRREADVDSQREQEESNAEFVQQTMRLLDQLLAKQRVQWTAELLSSTFALPDGTLIAWGAATIEHHKSRRAMFVGNAQANLEGAARHEQAIRDLTAANVATLSALMVAAA